MVDQKKLAQFWDKDVPEKFKHFSGSDFDPKVEKCRADIKRHFVDQIDFTDVRVMLDWGCGGGIGSLLLSEYSNVIALDIAESSLESANKYMREHGKAFANTYKLDDIETLTIKENVDLLFSASVVQHFPSLDYWRKVAAYWKSLEPKWIAVQTRHGEQNKSNEKDYFDTEKNYILGLYLTTEEVTGWFDDCYELKYHELIDDNYTMYEYFVFKRQQ